MPFSGSWKPSEVISGVCRFTQYYMALSWLKNRSLRNRRSEVGAELGLFL